MAERFQDLNQRERRQAIARGIAFMAVAWVVLFSAYFFFPDHLEANSNPLIRLGVGVTLMVGVIIWQGRRIVRGRVPQLRAVEALGTIVPLFLVVFASAYLATSRNDVHAFTQPLNHIGALYFTITVFSTVGFGDITPVSDGMRIAVAAQMLLDLILIGTVVRLIFSRAQRALTTADKRDS